MKDNELKKLEEFQDRNNYYKKVQDMQKLTVIDNKIKNGIELNIDELRFLYEIDAEIKVFGYQEDPRIEKIKNVRNQRQDIAKIFNCKEEEIGIEISDLGNPNIKYFFGSVSPYELCDAKSLAFPEVVIGHLDLRSTESAEGLVLPKMITGSLNLSGLTNVKGLVLPEIINGGLSLYMLKSAENLVFPKVVNGDLNLLCLRSIKGSVLPEVVNGNLFLNGLTSAEGIVLPKTVNGDLFLNGLTSAKGLVLPEKINGCLFLNGLTSAEGLVLPDNFDLNKLHCPNYIIEEIYNNLDKYYQKEETDDYKLVKKIEMIYI